MTFAGELDVLLPPDLPHRETVRDKAAAHLAMIVETNRQFNLTRITDPREAAIKHVLDSLCPWRLFADASHVLDAGTGAGFPGIPLALALPEVRFTLCESTGKKARFVESVARELDLANVEVSDKRAEEVLKGVRPDLITARAVAPLSRACGLLAPALKNGGRALLYKGPDAQAEISEAAAELRKHHLAAAVAERYELPDGAGSRTVVELSAYRKVPA